MTVAAPAAAVARPKRSRRRATRSSLLYSVGLIAMAGGATIASGQTYGSFLGNYSVAGGSVAITRGNNVDTINVSSPTAVIDWSAYGGANAGEAVDFQYANSQATFQSSTQGDFTVLNRITTEGGNPVKFDGAVNSQIIANGVASRGGSVWFYSPDGIVLGGNAKFNVGSLVLTTNAITTTNGTTGETFSPIASGVRFTGASGGRSLVQIQPGATITAPQPGSYLAVVAPRIEQAGTVNVNGSVGYVAAEKATVTVNAGLFTITGTIGSTVDSGGETTLSHTGTTTGAAATSAAAPHNIYLVAIPQNDAVTMLVGGTIGYQAATSASVVNGQIELGADGYYSYIASQGGFCTQCGPGGYSYANGAPDPFTTTRPANISITGGTFTSPVAAFATGAFTMATTAGDIGFTDFTLNSPGTQTVSATAGRTISGGNLSLLHYYILSPAPTTTIDVATGGTLSLTGNLSALAFGASTVRLTDAGTVSAANLALDASAGDDSGGVAELRVNGGTLTVAGDTRVRANAETGDGPATGGQARVVLTGGTANLGTLTLDAGAVSNDGSTAANAGSATVSVTGGGTLQVARALSVRARAAGAIVDSGTATSAGGTVSVTADGGTIRQTGAGTPTAPIAVTFDASAGGGTATGGGVTLSALNGGTLATAGTATISTAGASGSSAGAGAGASAGTGGGIVLLADAGRLTMTGALTATSGATGDAVRGGDATGGAITLTAIDNGRLALTGNSTFRAIATAGSSAAGVNGVAQGGGWSLGATDGGGATLGAVTVDTGAVAPSLNATAGQIAIGSSAGNPPTGTIDPVATTPIAIASITASAGGFGSGFTTDGVAISGDAPIRIAGDASFTTSDVLRVQSTGRGTLAVGGTLTMTGSTIQATRTGGASGVAGIATANAVLAAPNAINIASLTASGTVSARTDVGGINITSPGALHFTSITTASAPASLQTAGDLTIDGATIEGALFATVGGAFTTGTIAARRTIEIETGGNLTATSLTSAQDTVDLSVGGAALVGTASAGDGVSIAAAGTANLATIVAGTDPGSENNDGSADFGAIGLRSGGDLTVGTATAYSGIGLASAGKVTASSLSAGAGNVPANGTPADAAVAVLAGGDVAIGAVSAPRFLYVGSPSVGNDLNLDPSASDVYQAIAAAGPTRAGGNVTIGNATAGTASIGAQGSIAITGTLATTLGYDADGTLDGDARFDAGGAFTAANLAVNTPADKIGSLVVDAASIDIGTAVVGRDTTLRATGPISVDALTTERDADILVAATTPAGLAAVTVGSLTAGDDLRIRTPGDAAITTLTVTGGDNGTPQGGPGYAGNSAVIETGSLAVQTAALPNGTIDVTASAGGISFGRLSTGNTDGNADGHVTLAATGAIAARGLSPAGAVSATGSAVTLAANMPTLRIARAVATGGSVAIQNAGAVSIEGPLSATRDAMIAASGDVTAGDLAIDGGFVAASSTGRVTVGNVRAGSQAGGGQLQLSGARGVTAGNLTAYNTVSVVSAAGPVTTGDVASIGNFVRLAGAAGVSAGTLRAAGSIFVTSRGAVAVGDATAGTGPRRTDDRGFSLAVADAAPAGIAAGFDANSVHDQYSAQGCDDCDTDAVPLPFTVNYFGNSYRTTFVGSNGYLTFGEGQSDFTPEGLATGYSGNPIIAAFFADIDTRNPGSAVSTYGGGSYAGRQAFGATWNGVGYYSRHADKLNNFQIILTDRSDTGAGNFDIYYNYTHIGWETGDYDGGLGGLGGSSAAAGFNAGTGNQAGTFYEIPGSRVPGSFIDGGTMPLALGSNDGVPGQFAFAVRNGQIVSTLSEPATIHIDNSTAAAGASVKTGALSAEAVDVRGAGAVTTGSVSTADRGSGVAATGESFRATIAAAGPIVTGPIDSTGTVTLATTGGDVSAGAISTRSAVNVTATGAIELAGIDAAGAVAATAGGVLTIEGAAAGAAMTLTSGDVAIAPGATVGDARTTSIAFVHAGGGRTFVGDGTGAPAGAYTLDAGELGRVHAGSIAISGPAASASAQSDRAIGIEAGAAAATGAAATADLLIGDLTLAASAGGNVTGAGGTLSFSTPGSIALTGRLALTGAGAGNGLGLTAGGAITGQLPAAGIAVTDASGALTGTLALAADRILFATPDAATAVGSAGSLGAIDQRLAANDGNVAGGGYLRADSVRFTVGRSLYTQNSGASAATADRAGVTAGAGGIAIAALDAAGRPVTIDLVLNGALASPATTGADLVGAVRTASGGGAGRFSAASTINGCPAIGTVCGSTSPGGDGGGGVPVTEQINRLVQPVQDVVGQVTLASGLPNASAYSFDTPTLISLVDLAPLASAPLIEGPVTGAGNDDLWVGVGVGRELAPMGGAKKDGAGTQ